MPLTEEMKQRRRKWLKRAFEHQAAVIAAAIVDGGGGDGENLLDFSDEDNSMYIPLLMEDI